MSFTEFLVFSGEIKVRFEDGGISVDMNDTAADPAVLKCISDVVRKTVMDKLGEDTVLVH